MEAINLKKDSWVAWTLLVSALFVLTFALTGCSKDNKNARGQDNGGRVIDPGCTGCGNYSTEIISASNGSAAGDLNVALSLFSPVSTNVIYTGAVDVEGYLEVLTPPTSFCAIDVGVYDLRVRQPNGVYGNNSMTIFNLTNFEVEAIHRNSGRVLELFMQYVEFEDAQQYVSPVDGRNYPNSFWGDVYFVQYEGTDCGGVSRFFPKVL